MLIKKSVASFAPRADFVNFLVDMEPGSSSADRRPAFYRPPSPASPEDPWQPEDESDQDPGQETTVAASYIQLGDPLDPMNPADQDGMDIRVDAVYNTRLQELYDQCVAFVAAIVPDEEEQERLKTESLETQEREAKENEEKEEKERQKKEKAREEKKQRPRAPAW